MVNQISGAVPEAPEAHLIAAIVSADTVAALALFATEPDIDDPFEGQVVGQSALAAYIGRFTRNLQADQVGVEFKGVTRGGGFSGTEFELTRTVRSRHVVLPAAVVGELDGEGGLVRARIYYRRQFITGQPSVRNPILQGETTKPFLPQIQRYMDQIEDTDAHAMLALYEDDPYLVGAWPGEIKTGRAQVLALYENLYSHFEGRGVRLEHANTFNDGVTTVVEFNSFTDLPGGEAGVSFYELGETGRILAARIHDETN